jgi:hypothetical protein
MSEEKQEAGMERENSAECSRLASSTGYVPETPFVCADSIIYNLRQNGWRKGKPEMSSDIAVYIHGNHLPKDLVREIAETICTALNRKYIVRT